MSYKDFGFNKNLSQKIEISKKEDDYSIHGKRIQQKTFPFVLPIKTEAQRDSISNPQAGLTIYNSDTNEVNIFNGKTWEACLATSTSTSTSSSSSTSITSI